KVASKSLRRPPSDCAWRGRLRAAPTRGPDKRAGTDRAPWSESGARRRFQPAFLGASPAGSYGLLSRSGARKPLETPSTICFLVLGRHFKPLFPTISHRQKYVGLSSASRTNP